MNYEILASKYGFPGDWSEQAACAWDSLLAHPDHFASEGSVAQRRAIRTCQRCPVRLTCLLWSLRLEAAGDDVYGVVGGTSKNQRSRTKHCKGCRHPRQHPTCMSVEERMALLVGKEAA